MNSDEEVWILINMEKQTTLKFIYRIEYESREAHWFWTTTSIKQVLHIHYDHLMPVSVQLQTHHNLN